MSSAPASPPAVAPSAFCAVRSSHASCVGSQPPTTLRSEQLLGAHHEVLIDHHGVVYRLRVTGQGKLILTK